VVGVPALALAAVGALVVLRVKMGAGIGLAALPTADVAIYLYRDIGDTGGMPPAVLAAAAMAAAGGLLAWTALSPRLPPLVRMAGILATLCLLPAALLAAQAPF
jgi:hypothetical protein